jgi:serine O-acetyltransferase
MNQYPFRQLSDDIKADLVTYQTFAAQYSPPRQSWLKTASSLLMPSLIACIFYRLSHFLYCHRLKPLAILTARINQFFTGVSITPASVIGGGLYIPHPGTGIVFQGIAGESLRMYAGAAVYGELTPLTGASTVNTPTIGHRVSLGAKTQVIGDVTVGNDVTAGFNCIIFTNIPNNSKLISAHVRNQKEPINSVH